MPAAAALLLVTAAGAPEAADDEVDETGVVDWDWDDGCCSELSVVVPDTLSGALGWPPSSGDGAILVESVKRREIISGRRRQVRPPPDRGRGSRNCAVPAVLPPGPVPFGNVCISLAPPSCYFAASSTADLSLLLYIRYILYLHTHCTHLLLRAILLLLLGASAAAVRVFFLLFDFGGFFFLNYCATKLLLLLVLLTSFALSLSPSLSLFLPFSLLLSFALLHCALKLVFECFTADTKTCVRVCSFAFTHTSTLAQGKSRASSCFFSAPCCTHRLLLLVILIQVLLLRVSRNILAPRRGGRPLGTGGRPYSMKLVATCAAQLR